MYLAIDMMTLTVVSEQRSEFGACLAANNYVTGRGRNPGKPSEGAYVIWQNRNGTQEIVWTTWQGPVTN